MVFAHGVQYCHPRTVDLGNTLVIMNCTNEIIYITLEIWYQIMIFATSTTDITCRNVQSFLDKVNALRQSVKNVTGQDLCAFYNRCPNILFSPICGGFTAKLPIDLYHPCNPQNPVPTAELERVYGSRKNIITQPIQPCQLTPFERVATRKVFGYCEQIVPNYYIHSDQYLGQFYDFKCSNGKRYQILGHHENNNITHTLGSFIDILRGQKPETEIPRIVFVIACSIGPTDFKYISTPVPNLSCMILRYINSQHSFRVVQRGGNTYIKKGKHVYRVTLKNGKLRLSKALGVNDIE